jgi:hypothetical protein
MLFAIKRGYMQYEYTDTNGVRISDANIQHNLDEIGKTEEEVAKFLGEEMMLTNGAAYYFLEVLWDQHNYFKRGIYE